MTDKEHYLEFWTPTLGAEEALRTWEVKEKQQRIELNFLVTPDIEPYQSMITGEMITSRSQHREHLKMHNATEIGNELPYMERRAAQYQREQKKKWEKGIEETVRRAVYKHMGD